MSLNLTGAQGLASELLAALVRDTRTVSATVRELERLAGTPDWTEADTRSFTARLEELGELVSRYRTGASILTAQAQERQVRAILRATGGRER